MRSAASHHLDEMPVFLSGVCIALNVADDFAVCLCRGIETEGAFDILVFQIAVNRLRAADDLYAGVMCRKILG